MAPLALEPRRPQLADRRLADRWRDVLAARLVDLNLAGEVGGIALVVNPRFCVERLSGVR